MAGAVITQGEVTPNLRRLSRDFQALRALLRLRILTSLAAGESNVAELGKVLRVSQPLLSWHLKELRTAGFVESRRSGREVVYRLVPARFCLLVRELEYLVGFPLSDQAESGTPPLAEEGHK